MKTITLKITGMHCVSCTMNIDGELEDTKGVKESSTNFIKAKTVVSYDETLVTDKDIIKIIKTAGYDASFDEK